MRMLNLSDVQAWMSAGLRNRPISAQEYKFRTAVFLTRFFSTCMDLPVGLIVEFILPYFIGSWSVDDDWTAAIAARLRKRQDVGIVAMDALQQSMAPVPVLMDTFDQFWNPPSPVDFDFDFGFV